MAVIDKSKLLKQFKLTIGDLTPGTSMDEYYTNFIDMAYQQLSANDISDKALASELGCSAIVLYAKSLMNGEDVASNPTLILLRNTLSVSSKGDAYVDGA